MWTKAVRRAFVCLFCILYILVIVSSTSRTTIFEDIDKGKFNMFARGKKKHAKYFIPLLTAALLIKSVLFPLAFKSMAIMAGISIILSTLSLLVSSMVGFAKVAKDSYQSYIPYISKRHQQNVNDKPSDMDHKEDFTAGTALLPNRFVLNPKLKTTGY